MEREPGGGLPQQRPRPEQQPRPPRSAGADRPKGVAPEQQDRPPRSSGADRRDRGTPDRPARQYYAPPDVKLFDVTGLLIVAGLAVAGFVLAVVLIKYGM